MAEMSIMVGPVPPSFLKEILPPGVEITPGDTKVIWDASKPDEVNNARETFAKLTAKGYTAFNVVGKEGEKGSKMQYFDEQSQRMILVPKIAGGSW